MAGMKPVDMGWGPCHEHQEALHLPWHPCATGAGVTFQIVQGRSNNFSCGNFRVILLSHIVIVWQVIWNSAKLVIFLTLFLSTPSFCVLLHPMAFWAWSQKQDLGLEESLKKSGDSEVVRCCLLCFSLELWALLVLPWVYNGLKKKKKKLMGN